MSTWCLIPNFVFYLLASLGYLAFSFGYSLRWAGRGVLWIPRLAHTFTIFGFLLHLSFLFYVYFIQKEDPFIHQTNDFLVFLSLGIVFLFLILLWQHRWEGVGSFFIPLAFLLFLFSLGTGEHSLLFFETLRHHPSLIFGHVVFAAVTLLFMLGSSLLGLVFLIHERKLKRKQLDRLSQNLPPLFSNEQVAFHWVWWGFIALTMVLITGALLISKVAIDFSARWIHILLAVGAWSFYAFILEKHRRGLQGRRILFLSFLGFASLLGVFLWS